MSRFGKIINTWPFHLFFLPFYFIGHIALRFSGMLQPQELFWALIKVIAGVTLFYFLIYAWIRNPIKAAIITTVSASYFLFFGDIKYTIGQVPLLDWLSHYKIFVPVTLFLFACLFYYIRKSQNNSQMNFYLSLLFIIYVIIDLAGMIMRSKRDEQMTSVSTIAPGGNQHNFPDIYYIVPDCYPSSGFQREMLGIERNSLDSILLARGFFVVNESKSNYSNTAFSMASTLSMDYISGVDTIYQMATYHYNRAIRLVKHSPLFTFLQHEGYRLYNLSIFDLADQPALKKDRFLSISTTQIVFYQTLWNCVRRDLIWQVIPGYLAKKQKKIRDDQKKFLAPQKSYNDHLLDTLATFPRDENKPVFLYAHLSMPHYPYFYDSNGTALPDGDVFSDSMITDRKKFTGYITYVNKKLDTMVSRLLNKSSGNAVIILQSDHALADLDWSKKQNAFRNYSAFYFPDRDYKGLYHGMSNINTFRMLLNKYFRQQLPILPDRSYYIK